MATDKRFVFTARDPDTGEEVTLNLSDNTITGVNQSGRLVTMDLGPSDVHVEQALTTYMVGYKPENMMADEFCPVIPVQKQSDKYWIEDKDDTFQLANSTSVSPNGLVPEVSARQSNTSYNTLPYALKTALPVEVEANADAVLRLQMRSAALPIKKLLLQREYRTAALITTAGSFASAHKTTVAAGAKWNGGASSNPLRDIKALCEASLAPIKKLVMNERVFNAFQENAQVQKFIASKTAIKPQFANASELSALLELPPIVVVRGKYKSSATAYSYIFPDHVALFTRPETLPPMGDAISWNTFRWMGAAEAVPGGQAQTIPGQGAAGGFCIRSYYNPLRGMAGTREVVAFHYDADVIIDATVAGLIIDAYQ